MIKRIPVCPFCSVDMVKGTKVRIPTKTELLNDAAIRANAEYHILHGVAEAEWLDSWKCEHCGFVALFGREQP